MSQTRSGDIDPELGFKIVKGKWLDEEHTKFLEALRLYGKDWDKI